MIAAQLVANSIALGAIYALAALGFVLVLNAVGAVNFAQGDLVVAGGFVGWLAAGYLPLPGIVLLPLVMAVMAGFGALASLLVYTPLRDRPAASVFISTIALGVIIQNGLNGAFGAAPRATPALIGGGALEIGALALSTQQVAIVAAAAVLSLALYALLHRTQLGRMLRAAAEDAATARALGVPVGAMIALSFALAAALAGAAGLMLANQAFVAPGDGGALMLKVYIAVVIGGWGRVGGAVAGAMIIAVFEVVVAALVSYAVAEAAMYGVLIAVLALRPQGLFGETARRRA